LKFQDGISLYLNCESHLGKFEELPEVFFRILESAIYFLYSIYAPDLNMKLMVVCGDEDRSFGVDKKGYHSIVFAAQLKEAPQAIF
jgi:hypothetical protein